MIKKTCSVMVAALLLGLTSCNEDNPWLGESGHGAIKLSLRTSGDVKKGAPSTRGEEMAGSEYFELPNADDFSIMLEKAGGSTRTFNTVQEFLNEESFDAGRYKISALYGRVDDEGFDKPHLAGSADIVVMEGQTTEAQILASLANTIFTVEYSDDFKKYFSDYSTTLHSKEYSYVKIDKTDTEQGKYAFVAPGEVEFLVSFTNHQGQSVTVQPASVLAEPGYHYNVKMNVEGEGYGAKLEITFDSSLQQEDVVIDLTKELFTSAAPMVNPNGFEATTPAAEMDFLEGNRPDGKLRFDVISHGGMQEVTLTLSPEGDFAVPFGNEIELIGANETQQTQLANMGINVKGLFRNPDQMAIVDFTDLPAHLPKGNYTISLVAKDKLNRTSTPVSLVMHVIGTELTASPGTALFGLNTGTLTVNYNGSNPEKDITFKAVDLYGVDQPCKATFVKAARSRAFEMESYNVSLELPEIGNRNTVEVKVFLFGTLVQTLQLPVQLPEYSIQVDAFAKKVMVKVTADDPSIVPVIVKNLTFSDIDASRITDRDETSGVITVTGFTPGASGSLTPVLAGKVASDKTQTFLNEEAAAVPNGDFSAMTETINIPRIQVGSKYGLISTSTYTNYSSIVIDTPDSWGSINDITCDYDGSSNKNTWYVVPSTVGDKANKTVNVRTVGYSHSGKDLGGSIVIGGVGNYYGRLAPARSDLTIVPGELFLGTRNGGYTFGSRPASLGFTYNYAALNGESGRAVVEVYNGSEKIASGSLDLSGNGNATVNLSGYAFGKKATSVRIIFVSSTASDPEVTILTGTDLKDNNAGLASQVSIGPNAYKALATGSVLTVSNVHFNY